LSDDDVWIVTVPNQDVYFTENTGYSIKTTVRQETKVFYFDTRKQAKKFCLERHYPLDWISVNTD